MTQHKAHPDLTPCCMKVLGEHAGQQQERYEEAKTNRQKGNEAHGGSVDMSQNVLVDTIPVWQHPPSSGTSSGTDSAPTQW
jgi:hypothetical protein